MPSRTIRPTQAPEPAPFAYTVAAPDGFTPNLVFATWDGTGASGAFLPCVSYYNADGVLLGRAFPDGVTLHAGNTADVSYSPFRRGGGGASTAPLIVKDGTFTVNPTTEIDLGNGLTLFPAGTKAIIFSPVGQARAIGKLNNSLAAAPSILGLTLEDAQDITQVGNTLVIGTGGTYLLAVSASVVLRGPVALSFAGGSPQWGVTMLNLSAGPGVGFTTPQQTALLLGQNLEVDGSAVTMTALSAGDTLEVSTTVLPAGATLSTFNGRFAVFRVE